MTLLTPLGLLAGLLAIPVLALHILRAQRERHAVSSTMLWRELEQPVAPSRPWQKLRPSLPLLLQLLLVALLAIALAQPARVAAAALSDHTVFIVDTSASMLATDGDPDRVELAKQRVEELLADLPTNGSASLVVASGEPELLIVDSTDRAAIERELDRIRPTAGVADFASAFTLAEAAVSPTRETGWVLVSDGGVSDDDQRLAPVGTRFESIGEADVNRAITSLAAVVQDGELAALVTMVNTGGPASTQELRVDVDGATVGRRTVELAPGETVEVSVPIPPGSRVEAFLDGPDLLLNDNQRSALVPLATDLRVRVASDDPDGSFFVEEVLEALGAELVLAGQDADLIVYDGVAVPAEPDAPFISIASPVPPAGITVLGSLDRPIPTFVAEDVVLRDVDVTRTAIARSQALDVASAKVLIAGAEGEPLLLRGRVGQVRWYHVAFELEASNLPVEVAYPILFSRMVSDLTISDEVPASAVVGTRLPRLLSDSVVTNPRGLSTTVSAGGSMPVLDTQGFWTVESDEGELRPVAVVFPARESRLAVPASLDVLAAAAASVNDAAPAAGDGTGTVTRPLTTWIIIAALIVLLAELVVSWRRVAVPQRQLYIARATRIAILACLIGALLQVQWTRPNSTVRAVVVLDVSDSLGATGTADAQRFAAEMLDGVDADDIAIVEVGRTVRVTKPFDTGTNRVSEPPEGDGTDLARGIRLAASLLDGSTRERIVVVSDGLNTTGDVGIEVDRLAELGVQLDVNTVESDRAGDVSVDSVSAPSRVSEEEAYIVVATVNSDQAVATNVVLLRNDVPVAERTVDLTPGANEVTFDVAAEGAGLDRFEVRVTGGTDAVPQNDAASTAVSVGGPPKVLILEGSNGNGATLLAALTDRAVDAERHSVEQFPTLEELSTFGSVMLVDVEARQLTETHLDALDAHVRANGNGLVVVGGTSSFALGSYADTRLEDLLPVESRAEDPTRRTTVAEVLLIDASESMGACHCAPIDEGQGGGGPFDGTPIDGGVNKTDISRTAAERAIAALADDDEIGVLAFSGTQDWIVPLQQVGAAGDTSAELARLTPAGETRIAPALSEAADALRASTKELKHIILFSDGFSPELFGDEFGGGFPGAATLNELEDQARALAEEGITVSVVATGEGAAPLLEAIALAGNGRFYPGRDLEEIPEIFVEEARIASRSFINEGEYVPVVTSTAAPVRGLAAAPPISGFLASMPKDTSDVMLQVGEFSDPLLSSWRVGLGKVTAWTSDGGDRWAASWAGWDGWADFWSAVVRDTFPLEGASGHELRAEIRGESVFLELVSEESWPAGISPTAQVTAPDGTTTEFELERNTDTTFIAVVPALESGTYSLVASVDDEGTSSRLATAIATRSYPLEYRSADGLAPDLVELSQRTGGRGEIEPLQILDAVGLSDGSTARDLRRLLLIIAALLLPIDLLLHRVRLSTLGADLKASRDRRRRPAAPPAIPTAAVVEF